MAERIELGGVPVEVHFKDIKNVHLSVHPPTGRVTVSAPRRMSLETVRVFAVTKLDWIRRQQRKIRAQEREPEREFLERESHYVWGRRFLLEIHERDRTPSVELLHKRLALTVRPGTDLVKRGEIVDRWYREQLKAATPALIARWERLLGVRVGRVYVQRMRTRWGSCNTAARSIRLNTELAKKPPECLEYIVVHEMIHLLEPSHSRRFVALMDDHLPNWRHRREVLNRLPLRHEDWEY